MYGKCTKPTAVPGTYVILTTSEWDCYKYVYVADLRCCAALVAVQGTGRTVLLAVRTEVEVRPHGTIDRLITELLLLLHLLVGVRCLSRASKIMSKGVGWVAADRQRRKKRAVAAFVGVGRHCMFLVYTW